MSSILLDIRDRVAFITLNRPEKLNAFNREMALLLQKTLDKCSSAKEARCICITGAGKAFSAGQDLSEIADPEGPKMQKILKEHYNPIISRIRLITKPVVAVVNGVAAGAGANIALSCDVVVAARSASFIQAFSKIGLIPDSGGTFFLPRLVGWNRASALMMLGDKIAAPDALQMGMLYKVFEDETLEADSLKIAQTLAAMPTKALAFTKHLLNNSAVNDIETQLKLEDEFQQRAAATEDFKEGVNAFIDKRKPEFIGE
jgi:2-(1,2-epoxy-1,2-dihydrophenyl)acetyl-CoA isomerase